MADVPPPPSKPTFGQIRDWVRAAGPKRSGGDVMVENRTTMLDVLMMIESAVAIDEASLLAASEAALTHLDAIREEVERYYPTDLQRKVAPRVAKEWQAREVMKRLYRLRNDWLKANGGWMLAYG